MKPAREFEDLEMYLIANAETVALQKLRQVIEKGGEFDFDDLVKVAWYPQDLLAFLDRRENI